MVAEQRVLNSKTPGSGKAATPHKRPAQPCRSTQCRLYQTCFMLQRLHLTFQCPTAHQGHTTNTLAGLCALWLLSSASSSTEEKLQETAKPQPPETTTCPALPQHPVQAPPHLLRTAGLHLILQCPMACPGQETHTLAGLCALWLWSSASSAEKLRGRHNRNLHQPPAQPCRSTQGRLHHSCCALQELHLILQCRMACLGMAYDTQAGLCALWMLRSIPPTEKLIEAAKPQPQKTTAQPCRST